MATKTLLLTLTLVMVTLIGSVAADRFCSLNAQHVCAARSGMFGSGCRRPKVCQVKVFGGKLVCMCTRPGYDRYSRPGPAPMMRPRPKPRPAPEPFNFENTFEWMIKMQKLMNRRP